MRVGIIGLGKMGQTISRRLMAGGHTCIVTDVDDGAVGQLTAEGATGVPDPMALTSSLTAGERIIWIMVPAGSVQSVIDDLTDHLAGGDIVIDGGNSNFADTTGRAAELATTGTHLLDIGTSGGIWGLERGFSLMVGGATHAVEAVEPILDTLCPGVGSAPRTPGQEGDPTPAESGWLHCGPSGAGHFVKMVHNGIEYGMMAAIAEGLALLERAGGAKDQTGPTTTTSTFDFDLGAITEVWRRGSVVSSWLLDLTAAALVNDPSLDQYQSRVSDSGEGRWAAQIGVELGVPMPVLTAALHARFTSQGSAESSGRMLSAMRHQFGGHTG